MKQYFILIKMNINYFYHKLKKPFIYLSKIKGKITIIFMIKY